MPSRLIVPVISAALLIAGCGSSSKNDSTAAAPPATTPAATTPAATTAAAATTTPSSGGVAIKMQNISFSPKSVTVKVGQTITWTNGDSVDHNVTADSGAKFASNNFGNGGTYKFTATKAGTIKYECTIHPGMVGTITVQ